MSLIKSTLTSALSESRRVDRDEMVRRLSVLAGALGASMATSKSGTIKNQEVVIVITTRRRLSARVMLSGQKKFLNTFSLHWSFAEGATGILSKSFGSLVKGGVGETLDRSATHTVIGFEALEDLVARSLALANSGSAFRHPEAKAKKSRTPPAPRPAAPPAPLRIRAPDTLCKTRYVAGVPLPPGYGAA